jgi:hypothetical protein
MPEGSKSYSLYLSSLGGSPWYQSRNTVADVTYLINWDAVFNLNNHKFSKCKLRYEFVSGANYASNPLTVISDNGVLVTNGIMSRSASTVGGVALGLIEVISTALTSSATVNYSVTQNNFIGSITGSTNVLTISSSASPTFMLQSGDTISFYDPNSSARTTKTIATVTGAYTYTFTGAIGATGVTSVPFAVGNPTTSSYTYMKSNNLALVDGLSVEVPKGYRQFEVQLASNAYGQSSSTQPYLLTGTNLQDWSLILHFELYDSVPNDYTYSL